MDIYDQILENLELERELGTRTVEIDRTLLVPPQPVTPQPVGGAMGTSRPAGASLPTCNAQHTTHNSQLATPNSQPSPPNPQSEGCDIVFLTGRPLSAAGMEAMAKTFAAMKRIKPDIQVALNESRQARVTILLGSDALKKHFPSMRPVRGKWIEFNGTPTLMTFSPDYIFAHFQSGSPHERQAKYEMWEDIKSAIVRLHA